VGYSLVCVISVTKVHYVSAVCQFLRTHFYVFTRDSINAIARICHANSVCPSVTRVYCIKTVERIIEILSPSDRPIILVFVAESRCVNLTASPPTGAPNTRGVTKTSNFRPICGYISERVLDRGIVTMEDQYKVLCALSNSATFDDLE